MKDQITISFPGLGIEDFSVSKVAFSIGSLEIRWYGIIITLGMVAAVLYATYRAKQKGIKFDDMLDMALFTILFGVIGARLYYVIFYGNVHSFYDVIAIWEGGLAIYGGIIGGVLAIYGVCRYKKMNFFGMADMIGPGVMLAQAMGRWGNFFNGEAYGSIVPEGSPLYFLRMGLYPHPHDYHEIAGMIYVHPTFLYESIWNIFGFVLINVFYKKKKFDGEVALWYFAWYGFGRMFIEGLRTDSLMLGPFRISQLIGLLCFVAGTALMIWGRIHYFRKEKATAGASAQSEAIIEAKIKEMIEKNEIKVENIQENEEIKNGEDH